MSTINIKEVTKFYGEQKALNNITLSINEGEVVGLLGPNGAGKSTLMKILTSFVPPSEGKVTIDGYDVQEKPLEIRKRIGYLPEHNPLYHDMYIREYLTFVLKSYPKISKPNVVVYNTIKLTGLEPEQHKKIGALSKGYRQRVGLAQALIHDPDILILDEPTSGLDPNQLIEIRKIITDLGKKKTILLSTHIMQEVEALCNRVIIIDKGKIVADDTPKNLGNLDQKARTYKVEFKEAIDKNKLFAIGNIDNLKNIGGNNWLLESKSKEDLRETIFKFAVKNKYNVLSLSVEEQKMEDVFQKLTRHK